MTKVSITLEFNLSDKTVMLDRYVYSKYDDDEPEDMDRIDKVIHRDRL